MITTTDIFYVGDVSQILTPVDYTTVTPPEGLELTNWALIASGTGEDHIVSSGLRTIICICIISIIFYARHSWIKGTIDGDVISFPTEQFLVQYKRYFY